MNNLFIKNIESFTSRECRTNALKIWWYIETKFTNTSIEASILKLFLSFSRSIRNRKPWVLTKYHSFTFGEFPNLCECELADSYIQDFYRRIVNFFGAENMYIREIFGVTYDKFSVKYYQKTTQIEPVLLLNEKGIDEHITIPVLVIGSFDDKVFAVWNKKVHEREYIKKWIIQSYN
tara:strand:+ start:77 stop:607 length:531 start_codon:yes stop_codon:yes gene_type:complete